MKEINQQFLSGERALFQEHDSRICYCTFADGESPLKESRDLEIENCLFRWKYPLWYSKNVTVKNSALFDMARAGIWYGENISVRDTVIEAPKNFRRTRGIVLENVDFPNASETMWNCQDIEIRNSRLLSKDAFWNAENVTVYDSFISGEYLGWNSKNVTLVNCVVESLQGMCYIDNLVMKNCRLVNTVLAFEYSQADVEIVGSVDSVFNPKGGIIRADRIGELIMDGRKVKIDQTRIEAGEIGKRADRASWEV